MTPKDKKYIKEFGPAACLYGLEIFEKGELSAYEVHKRVCHKYLMPFKPSNFNQNYIGAGIIKAGRAIKAAGDSFR